MPTLEILCNAVREDIRASALMPSTALALESSVGTFLKMTNQLGISEPDQALYDKILALDLSTQGRKNRIRILKLIDKKADSRILDFKGCLLNDPDYLTPEKVLEQGKKISTYPVPSGSVDLLSVIGIALAEIKNSEKPESTVGQYWFAWRRLYAWFYTKRNTVFDLNLIVEYRSLVIKEFEDGKLSITQKQNHIKAIDVMLEIARRGFLDRRLLHRSEEQETELKRLCCHISDELTLYSSIAQSTLTRQRSEIKTFCRLADQLGITKPGQKMFDTIIGLEASRDVRDARCRVMRLIDAKADTRIIDENGFLLNEPEFLSMENAITRGQEITKFPVDPANTDVLGLIGIAIQAIRELQLSESTIGQYWKAWRRLYAFLYARDDVSLKPELINSYISDIKSEYLNGSLHVWKKKIYIRVVNVLNEVAEKGTFDWKLFTDLGIECKEEDLSFIVEQYKKNLYCQNLAESTINLYSYCFRLFLQTASINNLKDLEEISPSKVQLMMSRLAERLTVNSRSTVFPIIRSIIQSLWKDGYIKNNWAGMVITPNHLESHLRPYISEKYDERLNSALKEAPCRTRAIISLAINLGLREIDVLNLKFTEINWQDDRIDICQKKTGNTSSYPLLPDVGNALMDYILTERPKEARDVPYVFVRHQAPYRKLSGTYKMSSDLLKENQIKIENRESYGLHTYRHTLTYRLLRDKVAHQVITDVLGHVSKESDKPYLSMEEDMLRQCPLDLSVCGNKYWEGDDFH